MKTVVNGWFITGCLVWLIVFTLRKIHHPIPYVNGYVTDVFAIPVIANLGLWFQRVVLRKDNRYVLTKEQILFIVIYVSLVFELLLPHISKIYTGDWIDVLMYVIGGLFFYKVMNKPVVN
jgi:hypothetical protein